MKAGVTTLAMYHLRLGTSHLKVGLRVTSLFMSDVKRKFPVSQHFISLLLFDHFQTSFHFYMNNLSSGAFSGKSDTFHVRFKDGKFQNDMIGLAGNYMYMYSK
jgi:hypothetical protein